MSRKIAALLGALALVFASAVVMMGGVANAATPSDLSVQSQYECGGNGTWTAQFVIANFSSQTGALAGTGTSLDHAYAANRMTGNGDELDINNIPMSTASEPFPGTAGTFTWADGTTETVSFPPAVLPANYCGSTPVSKDATASVSTTNATCSAAQKLVYGTITNATFSGTKNGTEGPATYSVTATAASGHAFADGSATKSFTGTLAGKLTGSSCTSSGGGGTTGSGGSGSGSNGHGSGGTSTGGTKSGSGSTTVTQAHHTSRAPETGVSSEPSSLNTVLGLGLIGSGVAVFGAVFLCRRRTTA